MSVAFSPQQTVIGLHGDTTFATEGLDRAAERHTLTYDKGAQRAGMSKFHTCVQRLFVNDSKKMLANIELLPHIWGNAPEIFPLLLGTVNDER